MEADAADCRACGSPLPAGARFCPVCARPVARADGASRALSAGNDASGALPSGNDASRLPEVRDLGWNWGGFLLPYLWLVGHGRLAIGFVLLVSAAVPFVCLVHLILYPLTALYLGLNGYEISWRSQPCHSVAQLREREREWTLWGLVIYVLVLASLGLFLIYLRTLLEPLFLGFEELGG